MRFLFLMLMALEHMAWSMVALVYGYNLIFVLTMVIAIVVVGFVFREIKLNRDAKGRHAV